VLIRSLVSRARAGWLLLEHRHSIETAVGGASETPRGLVRVSAGLEARRGATRRETR
jgi:hypothetical protein